MLETPVLFLIFNRPSTTQKVFDVIRNVKPRKLFIAADGPRTNHFDDVNKVAEARKIATQIDWDCEIKTLFRDQNLGCGLGPAEAISWFFENVEEGIILEDDCLPDPFFFQFCTELLHRYRSDRQIMHISGNNFQNGIKRGSGTYYFSAYSHNWGWATWKSKWMQFKYAILDFDEISLAKDLKFYGFKKREVNHWVKVFNDLTRRVNKDVWDYQWEYAIWRNRGLSILPNHNLVKNIGFGADATHTKQTSNTIEISNFERSIVKHPDKIAVNVEADHYTFKKYYKPRQAIITTIIHGIQNYLNKKNDSKINQKIFL